MSALTRKRNGEILQQTKSEAVRGSSELISAEAICKLNTRSKNVKYLNFEGFRLCYVSMQRLSQGFNTNLRQYTFLYACSNGAMHAYNTIEKEMKSSEFTKAQVIDMTETRDSVICKLKD